MGKLIEKWKKNPEQWRYWYFNWTVGSASADLEMLERNYHVLLLCKDRSKNSKEYAEISGLLEEGNDLHSKFSEPLKEVVNLWRLNKQAAWQQYGDRVNYPIPPWEEKPRSTVVLHSLRLRRSDFFANHDRVTGRPFFWFVCFGASKENKQEMVCGSEKTYQIN